MTRQVAALLAVAYSYIRFSTPEQAKGDSLRRQTDAALAWCQKNGAVLDTSLAMRDLGKSAYLGEHRKNPDRYALAAFLKLVQDGRIPRGSYLVIESLDRLTREHVRAGLMLLLGLIESGIRIVQLSPNEIIYDEKSDEMGLMLAIVEMARGHRESKMKSERVGAAWIQKRKRAQEQGEVLTHRLPAWIEEVGGKLQLIPKKAAAVKRVFELAAHYGCSLIPRKLAEEGVASIGGSAHWTRSYVGLLLNDRRVVGQFQPRLRNRKPEGEAIEKYFPAAVSEELFNAARAAVIARSDKPGRVGKKEINVFANLIREARTGESYIAVTRVGPPMKGRARRRQRTLVTAKSIDGTTPAWAFPFVTFERAILALLAEVKPSEIIEADNEDDGAKARVDRMVCLKARIGELERELTRGDVAAVVKVLRQLEDEKRELAEEIKADERRAASPASEAWTDTHNILAALDSAPDPDDARMRLRSALRRIIASIDLLVVPRGRDRVAAVQVNFAESNRCRSYIIVHRAARSNDRVSRTPSFSVRSFADAAAADNLDLQNAEDVAALTAALESLDLSELE